MKIAFDHTIFLLQKYGGISRYFLELQNIMQSKNNIKIFSPIYLNNYLYNKKKYNKIFTDKKNSKILYKIA